MMNPIPFIDIHTHPFRNETETVTVQNLFPGDGFAAFSGRNFYSVGLHPWHIKSPDENNEKLIMVKEALDFNHVIFVGECGLDKKAITNFEEQKRVFEAQAIMAEEFEYPLIIHCVKAYNEVLELHKKLKPAMSWIMHSYNGNIQITQQILNKGFLFSFGENLFKSNPTTFELFQFLALNTIFFETDEFDGEVEKMYQKAAEIREIPIGDLKMAVWENFNRIEKRWVGRS